MKFCYGSLLDPKSAFVKFKSKGLLFIFRNILSEIFDGKGS